MLASAVQVAGASMLAAAACLAWGVAACLAVAGVALVLFGLAAER